MKSNNISPQKLNYLIEIISEINGLLPIDLLLEKIVKYATKAVEAQASSLLLLDETNNSVYFKISLGEKAEEVKKFKLKKGQGIAGWVIETGKSVISNDLENDRRFFRQVQEKIKYKTYNILCVPLKYKSKILGALQLINKINGDFTKEDCELLELFASQAAVSLVIAKNFKKKETEISTLKTHLQDLQKPTELVGKSQAIIKIKEIIKKVAPTDVKILITGESGTGKEVVARLIHYYSKRRGEPFVVVNCAAIPRELLESELFGYERGAFTGAVGSKKGKFEVANGGTLFLDEIAELPLDLQAKLLRAIQFGVIEKVGSVKQINVDVRIIAATNVNLENAVKEKKFREDLFYRLNVIPIHIPPLRERKEDIPLLMEHFLKMFSAKGLDISSFDKKSFLQKYKGYHWPGNVRELENIIEREIILSSEKVVDFKINKESSYPENIKKLFEEDNLKNAVEKFKKEYFKMLYDKYSNINEISQKIGISSQYTKILLKKYGII